MAIGKAILPSKIRKSETAVSGLAFCIPKTTRWASGSKEAYADEEKNSL